MAPVFTKAALLGGLCRGERGGRGPVFVNLDLVSRCNNVCLGCFYHGEGASGSDGGEMPVELAMRLASELTRMGVAEVVMAGEGEPMLHPRFFDVIAGLRRAGLRTQVFTNGISLDGDTIARIVPSGIDVLRVSIWAVNAAEHERWHPGVSTRMLAKRLNGIRGLANACRASRHAPELWLQFPINRENLGALDDRVALAIESGVGAVGFSYYRAYGSPLEHLALDREDWPTVRLAFDRTLPRLRAASIRHDADTFLDRVRLGRESLRTPCYAPWFACSIRVNGDVSVCPRCTTPVGNVTVSRLQRIWRGPDYCAFRRQAMRQTPAARSWPACECANCCWTRDNLRAHRVFKWIAPLAWRREDEERHS